MTRLITPAKSRHWPTSAPVAQSSQAPKIQPMAIQPMVPQRRTAPKSFSPLDRWAKASELVSATVGA